MTDKELIQALRNCPGTYCYDCEYLAECPHEGGFGNIAARLEALLTEVEKLKAQMPKWRPVSEPPKEDDYYLCRVKSFLRPGRTYVSILEYCNGGFREGQIYTDDVTGWMPLPSTEGVE